ncbi:MAG: sulfotransferase [Deltaproteobacteria bacterium]|nr:sulfotransferase [Deltaproteobacteria bacterium]MBW1871414.1 sulfotransferase [Deltaproteobacteria bacterium]
MTIRSTSRRYDRPHRPLPILVANKAGKLLEHLGIRTDLDEESLMEAARRKTGLADFGDNSFRGRMRILLESVNDEARLHPLGRFLVRQNFIRLLVNRLRIEEAFKRNPEIDRQEIESPLFIVGLQRTGTTLLHRLLASDPGFRYLASWEAINPAPIPGKKNGGTDPRIRMAEIAQFSLKYLAPDFFAIHPIEARGPEEDCLLFDFSFWSTVPEATQRVSRFSAWLEQQDYFEAYRDYKRILKFLQFQNPQGRWLLKTPQHLENLDSLLAVFPKAMIIQTHRDPVRTLASFCSMIAHSRGVFSDEIDTDEVGRHWLAKSIRMIQRSLAVRNQMPGVKIHDVSYHDLIADPIKEIRRIHRWLGKEISPELERKMNSFIKNNPQHKHGRHRYSLGDFGLDRQKVKDAFAEYCSRFEIPNED